MFADMVGYTALMQQNELLAREKRKKLKEILEEAVKKHSGTIIQYYGDGSLTIFDSAINGVLCAVQIQTGLRTAHIDVRIGIHTGDVTIEEGIIYGDSVNIASRIESLAVPGSVLISEKVHDEIRNQHSIGDTELGYFELKNISDPVRIFAIRNEGIIVPAREAMHGKTKAPFNRLAVLPFVNMSSDPENEYFSDGITEELLNTLTKLEGLQVTSRTSVFAFKGRNEDIREIASRLNVDKVLEGSIRKSGKRVRITAQLINAMDGYHIWSETYDRDLTDIFDVQDEISGIIANKLRENLTGNKARQSSKLHTHNIDAYTQYLKGLHFVNKITPADTRKAIECFEKAIAIEPGYALCYAMAAIAYGSLGSSGQMSPHQAFDYSMKYAAKALDLDNDIAEGHIAKATVYLYYDWNWKKAFESLQTALELNPGATDAFELLGFYYISTGDIQKAVQVMENAEKLDPLSPGLIQFLGNIYIFAERYDDALLKAAKLLEIQPEMRAAIELKAWATGMKGDWQQALELFMEVHRLTGHPLKGLMGVGFAYARLGRRQEALDCVRKIEKRQELEPGTIIDADLVAIWFALDDYDKAFYHINECVRKRLAPVNFFLEYPILKDLKSDPRYSELKKIYSI
jgi:adenylate cyclase